MIPLTNETYSPTLSTVETPVLLLFWAPHDQGSVTLYRQLETTFGEHLPTYSLDIVAQQDTAITVELMGLPTLLVVQRGQILLRLSGPAGCRDWENSIKDWMGSCGFL